MRFLVPLAALMIATPALADDDFCALRPGLANGACTAAKGDVYLETSLADWSLTRDGGQRSYSLSLGSSALRYGLTDTTELQLSVHPFIRQIGHTPTSRDVTQGNGDATIGVKQRLTPKGAKLQLALNPTITLPIATNGLGAGDVEADGTLERMAIMQQAQEAALVAAVVEHRRGAEIARHGNIDHAPPDRRMG